MLFSNKPESSELWKKFQVGVDEPDNFPPIYTQSTDDTRFDQYVYCWLCTKGDKFHKILSLKNITKLHQQHLPTKTPNGETCLQENLYVIKYCYGIGVNFAIIIQRLLHVFSNC
jgi:hypothetical protein